MNEEAFSIGEAIRAGWNEFRRAPGFWIGVTLVVGVVSMAPDTLSGWLGDRSWALGALVDIAGWVLYFWVFLGWADLTLRAVDGRPVSLEGLLAEPDRIVPCLISSIIFTIAMVVGLILLVVPGVLVLVMWYFYVWAIVDEGAGGMESLKRSAALTKGHRVQVFLFLAALLGVNLLGILAIGVGLLVTMPLSMIASAHAYRCLQGAGEGAPEVPAPATL